MPIRVSDILNAKEPATAEELAAFEREHEENRRYEWAEELYKSGVALFRYEDLLTAMRRRLIEQQMQEARRAELDLYWDEPAP